MQNRRCWLLFVWLVVVSCAVDAVPAGNRTSEAADETATAVSGKSNSDDFYEMLLRYVAENAFKDRDTRKIDYQSAYDAAASKSDNNQYEADLHHHQYYGNAEQALRTSEPAPYQQQQQAGVIQDSPVQVKDLPENVDNYFYYYYPASVKKGSSYGAGAGHKGKDKDVLWEILEAIGGKKKFKFEEALFDWLSDGKGHHSSYGRPAGRPTYVGGQQQQHVSGGYEPSKADVFMKVKLLAIASTALLIVLGGLILLAPLIVAKGRSAFVRQQAKAMLESNEFTELTHRVLSAIRNYRP